MEFEAYALGSLGAIEGVYRYVVRPELTAKRGWLAVAGLIAAYELACPVGETLSDGVDRALEAHKLLTAAVVGVTALHLLNVLPPQIDPFSHALGFIKG